LFTNGRNWGDIKLLNPKYYYFEHHTGRLRVFENKVLRRIFGPKRDEVTGVWRRLHNKEL
jgi:hypothetical protein